MNVGEANGSSEGLRIAADAETESNGRNGGGCDREATAPTTPQKGERASGYSSSNSDAMAAKSSTEP